MNKDAALKSKERRMSSKVLIIIGDAVETVDTLYPYYRLQEDGFEPVVAAPERRHGRRCLHC